MNQQKGILNQVGLVFLGFMFILTTAAAGHAATFTVNDTADAGAAANVTACQTNAAGCTLRAAVLAANASAGVADTIILPSATFVLTGAANEEQAVTGDLDVGVPGNTPSTITITGQGEALTIIDGGGTDRIFETRANGSSLTISGVTIRNGNTVAAAAAGGCIMVGGGTSVVLNDVIVTGCTAAQGGSIDNTGTLTMNTVALTGNNSLGGALNSGDVSITTWINGQVSGNSGGGINNSGTMSLTNVTISGNNAADNGAGIDNRGGLTLQNVTIASNASTAPDGGAPGTPAIGGFRNRDDRGGVASVSNTIVANNLPANCGGVIQAQTNNIDGDTTCGFDTAANPLLGALALNGGTLKTHALGAGSPAIDAGTATGCPATDARGIIRPVDGNPVPPEVTAICDIGAFEFRPQAIAVAPASPFNFGTVTSGTTADQVITVSNGGDGPLIISAITVQGLTAPFTLPVDTCSNVTLPGDASCTVTVRFAPTAAATATGSFNIPSNDPATPSITYSVSGTGTLDLVSNISVADSIAPADDLSLAFGNVTVGLTSDATITITSGGTSPLVIGTIASSNPLDAPFSITNDTCSSQTIAVNASCTLTVRYAPTANTASTDSFDIPSNDPDTQTQPLTISVSGSGVSAAGNQAPSAPALVSPANGATGLGASVTFTWTRSSDPDGDTVTHKLVSCTDPSFTGCTPVDVASAGSLGMMFAGIGSMGVILIGFVAGSGLKRTRKALLMIAIVLLTGTAFMACSSGGDGAPAAPVEMSHTLTGLASGTHFWKVVADDEKGGKTSSEIRSFTVQ